MILAYLLARTASMAATNRPARPRTESPNRIRSRWGATNGRLRSNCSHSAFLRLHGSRSPSRLVLLLETGLRLPDSGKGQFPCAGGKMLNVSRPPIDYEPQRQIRSIPTKPFAYWAAFIAGVLPGLFIASMTADLLSFALTGHFSDGGATIISAAGIPVAAIVAGVVREMRCLTSWRFSLCCGFLAAPVAFGMLILYSAL